LRSIANARRITAATSPGEVSGSHAWQRSPSSARVEVERHVGLRQRIALRHDQHGNTVGEGLGDPAHGIFAPGPCCITNTPIMPPLVMRLTASAMCKPVRSWRTMMVRMSIRAAASST
jgi:hypothetical protein